MGAGPQDITFFDMRNTLNMTYWESTKVMWTDVQTKNGVFPLFILQTGELTLEKLLNYRKEIEHTDAQTQKPKIDIYEYKAPLDTMLCRYMTAGLYDTEKLSRVTSAEGTIIQGLYSYRMNLSYRRLPASGYMGAGDPSLCIISVISNVNGKVELATLHISV